MTLLSNRLISYLDDNGIDYEVIHHRRDYTAQGTAADTHTPGRQFAKSVVLEVDGRDVLAVIPAHRKIDMARARKALGAKQAVLAEESRVRELFPDCEIGAEPPFGNLYHLPVYVSPELAEAEHITFNAGSHEDAVRVRYADFAMLVEPEIEDLAM